MPGLFEGFIARHRKGVTLTVLVLVSFAFLLVSNRAVVIKPKEVGLSFVGFFQKGFTGFFRWFGDTAGSIRQLNAARDELDAARARLQDMDRVTREIVELRRQNAMLRQQLDFAQTLAPDRIAAEVIARDSDNLFSTITINKGSRQGVRAGMPVVAYQGDMEGLVGKVLSVGPGASEVLPLYDPQCLVSARLDTTRDEGLVKGEGRDHGTVLLQYVKKTAKDSIQYGDLVVTSGLGGLYPKGINMGRVREIKALAYETSLEIEVEPIINFDRLENVFLIDAEAAPVLDTPDSLIPPGPQQGVPAAAKPIAPSSSARPAQAPAQGASAQ
ncbi:MAG TPA: rod shape-determining protein MreC [Spirochaetia bacterium]|nr:rod shape-determining protein MreC [Spirochaetia bacterium]